MNLVLNILEFLSNNKVPESRSWKDSIKVSEAFLTRALVRKRIIKSTSPFRLNLGCGDVHLDGGLTLTSFYRTNISVVCDGLIGPRTRQGPGVVKATSSMVSIPSTC